jgi:alginate O-acetyltransferase complex protein AlgI
MLFAALDFQYVIDLLFPKESAMLFTSLRFLYFFCIVFTAYWILPWQRARVYLLLVASFYFYASWNKWLAGIIFVSTTLDYLLARGMVAYESPRWRKVFLTVSVVANLGLLCYFKYANFFLHSVEQALRASGSTASLPVLQVMLPIGISFYTFEAISYTVDVYRRRIAAERNLAHFVLFITFFPHLVAGPIVRARDFLPQIRRPKHWNWARLHLGVQYIILGLVKKLIIADRMAIYAERVFAEPAAYASNAVWVAVLAYAIQIYCDFSGYTDMALGTAHMLGYKLAINFNMPYLAANVSEFWHRWHISLSTWLRDYVYIPLGGSRGSDCPDCRRRLTNRNLLVTMTLGGLWHGASWTFVVWGVLHGLYLLVHRAFQRFCGDRPKLNGFLQTLPGTCLRVAVTFLCVSFAWVFFRAQTFAAALEIAKRMAVYHRGSQAPVTFHSFATLAVILLLCHALSHGGWWKRIAVRLPGPVIGFGYATLVTAVLVLTPEWGKRFIYWDF